MENVTEVPFQFFFYLKENIVKFKKKIFFRNFSVPIEHGIEMKDVFDDNFFIYHSMSNMVLIEFVEQLQQKKTPFK